MCQLLLPRASQLITHYLALCGYVQPDELPEFLGDVVLIDKAGQVHALRRQPSRLQAHRCLKVINSGTEVSLTLEQQLALNKFYFHQRMGLPSYDWGSVGVEGQLCERAALSSSRWRRRSSTGGTVSSCRPVNTCCSGAARPWRCPLKPPLSLSGPPLSCWTCCGRAKSSAPRTAP
jgi:hypothetical protein